MRESLVSASSFDKERGGGEVDTEGKKGRAIQAAASAVPLCTALHHAGVVHVALGFPEVRPSVE